MLTIKTPAEYISQPGIINEAGSSIKKYGNRALVIGSTTALKVVGNDFFESLSLNGIESVIEEFFGFPCERIIDSYKNRAISEKANLIIGIGGGKVLDTAKVVGSETGLSVVTVPTIAATCAAWAAVSILYDDEGAFTKPYQNPFSPRLVIADSEIIGAAPSKYLKAGIIDTLAKWYETQPLLTVYPKNIVIRNSVDIARLAFDILEESGHQAVADSETKVISRELIDAIDAVIYLAGLVGSLADEKAFGGFAHPFYFASTLISSTRDRLHGEKVAFGLLVQFTLEKKPSEFFDRVVKLFHSYNQPITLRDIGIVNEEEINVNIIVKYIFEKYPSFTKFGYGYSEDEVKQAVYKTDELVRKLLE